MKGVIISRVLFVLMLGVLGSCSSPLKGWNPNDYTVKSGDTLYSIAWRYEIDPNDLVRWNNLQSASLIHPGQRLHTRQPKNFRPQRISEPVKPTPVSVPVTDRQQHTPKKPVSIVVRKSDTVYGLARRHGVSVQQLVAANGLRKPYVIHPGQKLKLEGGTQSARSAKPVGPKPSAKSAAIISWRWPLKGQIIEHFNRQKLSAKGINIASRTGRPVKAAAAGKVVYSGNGLISYGNLVIIRHNETYLSAYANNRKLLVKEGQHIKQGHIIAEVGTSAKNPPHLHFEIRKRGRPVDPLSYLPSS